MDHEDEIEPELRALAGEYLDNRRRELPELRAALGRGELGRVGDAAHRIKGTAASVGYGRLTELASALEAAARAGESAEAVVLLEEMLTYVQGRSP